MDKNKLKSEINKLSKQLRKIEDKERDEGSKVLVGKCFRYINNYSCPEKPSDYWNMYMKVIRVENGWLRCNQFEVDKNNDCFFRIEQLRNWTISGSYEQISQREYEKALKAFKKQVEKLSAS